MASALDHLAEENPESEGFLKNSDDDDSVENRDKQKREWMFSCHRVIMPILIMIAHFATTDLILKCEGNVHILGEWKSAKKVRRFLVLGPDW